MAERVQRTPTENQILDLNTKMRFYMSTTAKIDRRDEAVDAAATLWEYVDQMDELTNNKRPAVVSLVRLEILRLEHQFGITFGDIYEVLVSDSGSDVEATK